MTRYRFETEEHQIFRDSLRKYLEKEAVPNYDQWENNRLIPKSFWKQLGEMGYLCPQVEEQYGGLGLDFSFGVVISEELERVGSSLVGVGLHNDIVVPYIESYGTHEQKKKWLPNCVTGDAITAIAMTEPGAGSDLANIKTTAIRDGDHYIVNGQKTFITNGINGNVFLVAVKTDPKADPKHKGVSLLIIEEGTEGFTKGQKLNKVGLHAQDTAELYFEDCRVPVENLIGDEGKGFLYMMDKLQQERLVVAIAAQIASEDMLETTIDYIKSRRAFGKPISAFQNTQFKVAEMATKVELGKTFLESLIEDHIAGKDVVTKVSMAKSWLTETAREISIECMQLHGGYGYMEEYKIARRYRDIPVASIYAGTNEIMKVIIAKNLGL
ncbi:acyl-CoA dehydrogenase family protein [Sporosarcina pasteurii]|uniref:Acyl-CoA dehydrogenase, short-chain specific n=1 Tax=Sporosarcina pasteurii TaxID=1474 RepID=A0A380C6U1_SPOPA|nr:acyl-CoA dehydrogenase family protein [Sporosarcina pasteurii]MDS9471820.1 acyl-CoA dehydrogenase family protein [Sporosarcina pasteurii]QBQ04589.1 acyl-CoA dehydrogenase [Sporosarcina pasteurii]SUJ13969.1 Acyl-CoA dehydrogenase, short-chain specific [Sporosarcina pasteurii]